MSTKEKARHHSAGKQKDRGRDDTASDPVAGWYALGKESRATRKPKREWCRKGGSHGR